MNILHSNLSSIANLKYMRFSTSIWFYQLWFGSSLAKDIQILLGVDLRWPVGFIPRPETLFP
jgi:hypothetical protein